MSWAAHDHLLTVWELKFGLLEAVKIYMTEKVIILWVYWSYLLVLGICTFRRICLCISNVRPLVLSFAILLQ